jgi:hypothetical protein
MELRSIETVFEGLNLVRDRGQRDDREMLWVLGAAHLLASFITEAVPHPVAGDLQEVGLGRAPARVVSGRGAADVEQGRLDQVGRLPKHAILGGDVSAEFLGDEVEERLVGFDERFDERRVHDRSTSYDHAAGTARDFRGRPRSFR